MAIATCNIKVNGRWIRAGECYGEENSEPVKPKQEKPVEEAKPVEEKKPEAKPRTATRRKNTSK